MTALSAMGWEGVKALKPTFTDWKDAGNPVVEGAAEEAPSQNASEPDADLVAAMDAMLQVYGVKPFGVVDAEGFNTALVENPELIVIDVCTEAEIAEKGVVDTGEIELVAIQLEEFIANAAMWPTEDADIVVYCGSGHRSTMVMTILGAYGYSSVQSLKGGFGAWVEAGFPVIEYAAP